MVPLMIAAVLASATFLLSQRAILAWSPALVASESTTGLQPRRMPWHAPRWRDVVARAAALIMAIVLVIAFVRFDTTEALRVSIIASALVTCGATDLLSYRVPNAVTLPAIAFCFAWSLVQGPPEPLSALVASAIGGGLLLVAALLTRGGLGGGDVKLGFLAGAALGLPIALPALGAGIVLGSLTVIILNLRSRLERQEGFAFAPFLALPVVLALLVS